MVDFEPDDELFIGDKILSAFGSCTDCGLCCSYFETITIYPEEIASVAQVLSINKQEFIENYTKKDEEHTYSLQLPCPFLKNKKCSMYPHRFFICKTFPLCINLNTNEAVLSGIYICPQATQFYEGVLQFYKDHSQKIYQKMIAIEQHAEIGEKGMEISGPASLFSSYLDWLTRERKEE